MKGKIGVFVSDDAFSEYSWEKIKRKEEPCLFSFSPVSFAKTNLIAAGDIENFIRILQKEKIEKFAFIGRVPPELVFSENLHKSGKNFLSGLPGWKSEKILQSIVFMLSENGVKTVLLSELFSDELARQVDYTGMEMTVMQEKDIETGISFFKKAMIYGVGQALAVKNGAIVAVEGIEGTDRMIKRAGEYCRGYSVVKVAGKNKDDRFDLPVVGPETAEIISRAKGAVLAVEAGRTIIFQQKKVISICKRNNIIVKGITINWNEQSVR
jgi:UDP-2,3-diacylglucosamine hydrolase